MTALGARIKSRVQNRSKADRIIERLEKKKGRRSLIDTALLELTDPKEILIVFKRMLETQKTMVDAEVKKRIRVVAVANSRAWRNAIRLESARKHSKKQKVSEEVAR